MIYVSPEICRDLIIEAAGSGTIPNRLVSAKLGGSERVG
ncbi:Uncharacterized protein dnm_020550 [Desulfonema magnum]|uniref:Uncharacterized protein n=1 Tax=Desulfonema magnum TaxID=45655 RepID=A0A975GLR1_9BACT|nr:Uncharacterized protein dnm_020550 [Desulfonema magnum]